MADTRAKNSCEDLPFAVKLWSVPLAGLYLHTIRANAWPLRIGPPHTPVPSAQWSGHTGCVYYNSEYSCSTACRSIARLRP